MNIRTINKKIRRSKHLFKGKLIAAGFVVVSCIGVIGYANYMEHRQSSVDPKTYTTLLNLIAKAESNGNYNAYFGNAGNTSIDFTSMSIAQVRAWQTEYIQKGNPSNAVGKYQILSSTLDGLVQRLGLDTNQKFNPALQDKLAIALIERRGSEAYVNKELSTEEFAANLAKEWAALPKVIGTNPGDSYYASDGLNKSRIGVDEIKKAIDPIMPE